MRPKQDRHFSTSRQDLLSATAISAVLTAAVVVMALGLATIAHGQEPVVQTQKLKSTDAVQDDRFGTSVAISQNVALIGAPRRDPGGTVYLFVRGGDANPQWTFVKELVATEPFEDGDQCGFSVAIDANTAVVGCGGRSAGGVTDAGTAYVFERNHGGADNWGQIAQLVASDPGDGDFFGGAVAIEGDTILVGASSNDDFGPSSGLAYLFGRDQGGPEKWGQLAVLAADDANDYAYFGSAVAIDGTTAVIGAPLHTVAGTWFSGSAYVFEQDPVDPTAWNQIKQFGFEDPQVNAGLGTSVAISGDTILVGAPYADSDRGAVYVFREDLSLEGWGHQATRSVSSGQPSIYFGGAVSVSGGIAVIGSIDPLNLRHVFVYDRTLDGDNSWELIGTAVGDDSDSGDAFGHSVSVDGSTLFVGADEQDDIAINSGAAYAFSIRSSALFADDFESGDTSAWISGG